MTPPNGTDNLNRCPLDVYTRPPAKKGKGTDEIGCDAASGAGVIVSSDIDKKLCSETLCTLDAPCLLQFAEVQHTPLADITTPDLHLQLAQLSAWIAEAASAQEKASRAITTIDAHTLAMRARPRLLERPPARARAAHAQAHTS